jgi:hypothetical protein
VPRLRPFGAAAAVLQIPDINKGMFSHRYQTAMSLLMMDITFLEGQDGEVVVMELAAVTPRVTVSSHMYLRDRTAGIKYQRLTPE